MPKLSFRETRHHGSNSKKQPRRTFLAEMSFGDSLYSHSCFVKTRAAIPFHPSGLLQFYAGSRQVRWRIIHFASARLLHLLLICGAVVALRRQLVRLALVVPAFWVEPLGFLEVRDGFGQMSRRIELFAEAEFSGSQECVLVRRRQLLAQLLVTQHVLALASLLHPVLER